MGKIVRHFKPGDFKLAVRRSRSGLGLFALEKIPRGACIIEYIGRNLSDKEQEKSGRYFFWTSPSTMIDGNIKSNIARRINHSCAPNCEVDLYWKRIFIFAKRTIKPGEELTYDYDTEYFDEYIKPAGCRCLKCAAQ